VLSKNIVHIDDSGCLCETCTVDHELCLTWKFVVMMQAETHDRAPFYVPMSLGIHAPEVTVRFNILECVGYSPKEVTSEEE